MKRFIFAALILFVLAGSADAQLVVHEWGTFTSLQDEGGRTVGGINSDDVPVPPFCHMVRADLIQSLQNLSQGAPRSHPDVTMRLETPVMYFHLPPGAQPVKVDVTARFLGGWLTQYYPYAVADAPGLSGSGFPGHLTDKTVGTLSWKQVTVGSEGTVRETKDPVWLAPRKVDAAMLSVDAPMKQVETERYLFYRGVGHLESPVTFRTNRDQLEILSNLDPESGLDAQSIRHIWQYEMREDGSCAFQVILPLKLTKDRKLPLGNINAGIANADFAASNLASFKTVMHSALVADGLFADEAIALLNTWEASYFKAPGKRILFLLPQTWTDRYLPVTLSVPAKISRTMVGRVELVTPEHRQLLKQIAAESDLDKQNAAYDKLGRFRNGLVLDEQQQHPSESLARFIEKRSLKGFAPN